MPSLDDLKRDLADLGSRAFQQLAFELIHREDATAERPAEPDGGADALIPAAGGGADRVFQAKHYPGDIHWKDCQASLDQARKTYQPKRVTFVFPRDLSAPLMRRFEERLVLRHPDVVVDRWTLSNLAELLERHPDIASRHFRRVREDALRSAHRSIAQGGKPLDDGADLIERTLAIGVFTDGADPNFSYWTSTGGKELPEPNWDVLPYMTLRVADDLREVRVDAWAREGSEIKLPSWSFADSDEGRAALRETQEALAAGRSHTLTNGVVLRLDGTPVLVRAAMGEGPHEAIGEITLEPGDALLLSLLIETADEQVRREVPIRPVPSGRQNCAEFAGILGALFVAVELELLEPPTVHAKFSLTSRFGSDARTNLEAAEVMEALATGAHVHLQCPELLPKPGLDDDVSMNFSEEDRNCIMFWRAVFDDLVLVEDHAGFTIPLPDRIGHDELEELVNAARYLRYGEGELDVRHLDLELAPGALSTIDEGLAKGGAVIKDTISHTVFGRHVEIGVIEFVFPPMAVVSVTPSLAEVNGAHLRAASATPAKVTYRVLEKVRPRSRLVVAKSILDPGSGLDQTSTGIVLPPPPVAKHLPRPLTRRRNKRRLHGVRARESHRLRLELEEQPLGLALRGDARKVNPPDIPAEELNANHDVRLGLRKAN